MSGIATLTFVGPGEPEGKRLRQLFESILLYESGIDTFVIIDDQSQLDFATIVPQPLIDRLVVLRNPRNGKGNWWQGGLCVGLTEGLKWLAIHKQPKWVIRLDTDALVIGKFSHRLEENFKSQNEVGLVGTWDKYMVTGENRLPHGVSGYLKPILKKTTKFLTIWRHSDWPTRIQFYFFKRDRMLRSIVKTAIANGYQYEFLQGGAYAIRGELVKEIYDRGYLFNPNYFLEQFYSEDVLMTLLCYAGNFKAAGNNQIGEIFGVQWSELSYSIEELQNFKYSIIHAVKEITKREDWLASVSGSTIGK